MAKQINMDKHIWEGWTVRSFIEDLEPMFNQIQNHGSWIGKFKKGDEIRLKEWVKDNQPYYKKHIPDVYNYFKNKI